MVRPVGENSKLERMFEHLLVFVQPPYSYQGVMFLNVVEDRIKNPPHIQSPSWPDTGIS